MPRRYQPASGSRGNPYPRTVAEVLDDTITYRPAVLAAMRTFRRARPWVGTPRARGAKLRALNDALALAYGIDAPRLRTGGTAASYSPGTHTITLDRLSVVTFLHEFGHALGKNERQTCRWSINLFRRVFPRSFARLRARGHMLIKEG